MARSRMRIALSGLVAVPLVVIGGQAALSSDGPETPVVDGSRSGTPKPIDVNPLEPAPVHTEDGRISYTLTMGRVTSTGPDAIPNGYMEFYTPEGILQLPIPKDDDGDGLVEVDDPAALENCRATDWTGDGCISAERLRRDPAAGTLAERTPQ
jgi:hypothetical protein